jgi:hypothetical protein
MNDPRKGTAARLPVVLDASQLAGGLLILLFTAVSAYIYYNAIPEIGDAIKKAGARVPDGYGESVTLFLALYIPALLFFLSLGLLYFVKSLRSLLIPDLPTSGSQPFRDYEEYRRGLQEHTLSCYGPLGAFISAVFGKRTMYLSPLRKNIVRINGEKLKWRVLWVVLALLCIWQVRSAVQGDANPNYGLAIPFLWLIGLQIVMALADFSSCVLLVPQDEPRTDSNEALDFYKGFGHPTHLFSRLPDLGETLRLGEQPNRVYVIKGEKASVAVSDIGEFGGTFYIERQPLPIDSGRKESAYVVLAAGWLLRLLGCFLFLYMLLPAEIRDLARGGQMDGILQASPIFVLGMALAAVSAWRNGSRYYKQAADLIVSARFRSVGILINVAGEMSRADIRVGKAVTDSMESSNVAARSNFTARFWAAELISEARSSSEPRELLALSRTDESLQWIEHFKQKINDLREERVTPVGIDFRAEEVHEIADVNSILFADRVQALQGSSTASSSMPVAARLQALTDGTPMPQAGPSAPPPAAEDGENKECPTCAEIVRRKAKKCRFCGHQFEPA